MAAYGPGLSYGVAGEPCSFTIDTKNAGAGRFSLACILDGSFIPLLGIERLMAYFHVYHSCVIKCLGGLNITIEGPRQTPLRVTDNGDNTSGVSFTPEVAGVYKLAVTQAGKNIPGSPFICKVTG